MPSRILFVASTCSHLANFHLPAIAALAGEGWPVDAAWGGSPRDLPAVSRSIPLPLEKSMGSPRNLAAARRLRRLFRSGEYAMVCCHTALAAFFTRLALLGLRERPAVVCVVHGYLFGEKTPLLKKALLVGAEKLTAPVTDLLLTMNAWDEAFARRHRLGRTIEAIPGMGVDLAPLRNPDREAAVALRRNLGFGPEDILFLYPAEFSKRKNHALLLRAAAGLPENVRLLLPGEGALREETMALARTLGLEDRTVFPGQVSDMPLWYAMADGSVSVSRSEGLPFNVMEAMGAGLPVAVSDVKGHRDLVTHEVSGLLFPSEDESACREALARLARDSQLRRRLGERAGREVLPYSLERVLPRVLDCYRRVLPPRPGGQTENKDDQEE